MTGQRLVIGMTGATGAAYGLGLLRRARALSVETHLIVTPAGVLNAHHELGLTRDQLDAEADRSYAPGTSGHASPVAALPPPPWWWRPAL